MFYNKPLLTKCFLYRLVISIIYQIMPDKSDFVFNLANVFYNFFKLRGPRRRLTFTKEENII